MILCRGQKKRRGAAIKRRPGLCAFGPRWRPGCSIPETSSGSQENGTEVRSRLFCVEPEFSIGQRERDNRVPTLVVDLRVAASAYHDVLLAFDRIARRRRVHAGAGLEIP